MLLPSIFPTIICPSLERFSVQQEIYVVENFAPKSAKVRIFKNMSILEVAYTLKLEIIVDLAHIQKFNLAS